jgi:hypothetical protein
MFFWVGSAYQLAAWLLIRVPDTEYPRIGLPGLAVTSVIALQGIPATEAHVEFF